jgi:RHS repeat-associated protein
MPVTNYYTLDGGIVAERTGSERIDYYADALGSVVRSSTSNGGLSRQYRYKPYGSELSSSGSGTAPQFRWVGTLGYRPTGLSRSEYYMRARHYGTWEGRWTTVDPLWPHGAAYGYGWGDPIVMIDPSGECPEGRRGWKNVPCTLLTKFIGLTPTHECESDPCGYIRRTGQVKPGTIAFVACCRGRAYACLSNPGSSNPDVEACQLAHEQDHIKRNKSCRNQNNSGCRGVSPKDMYLGGGWFDTGNDIDECLAYAAEVYCLIEMMRRRKCYPKGGKGWGQRCGHFLLALQGACDSGREHCRRAGMLEVMNGCRILKDLSGK